MSSPAVPFREDLARLWAMLPSGRRRELWGVAALMFAGAIAEMLTIGAVVPLLVIVADPARVSQLPVIGPVVRASGLSAQQLLIAIAAGFVLIAVVAALTRLALTWFGQRFAFRIGFDITVRLYERILHQPYSYHVAQNSSAMLAAITKVQQIIQNVLLPVMLSATSAVISAFILIALVATDPLVALLSFGVFGTIYAAVSMLTRAKLRRNGVVIAAAQGERIQTVQEGMGGIRDVLLEHAQSIYVERFTRVDRRLREAQKTNAFIGASPRFVIEGLGMVLIALLAVVLSGRPGGLVTALPTLGALALGAQRLLPMLQQIYTSYSMVVASRPAFADVLALAELPLTETGEPGPPLPFERELRFDRVEFAYAPGQPVLHDVSLVVPKGARIGFIGRTGSGKSTAMDVLMGLLQPTGGRVMVDGVALDAAGRRAWQRGIAHVPQSIYLSDTTIAENIAFGVERGDIDTDRLHRAAESADIAAFIATLPDGYDTRIGERGVRLSGGQRQRLGIARALYKDAAVLVLDEATSALDNATEAAVMRSIGALRGDLTIVMIAHRLSTVAACDTIYRLEGGRIAAQGSYDEIVGARAAAG